jgi:hypothetical protein
MQPIAPILLTPKTINPNSSNPSRVGASTTVEYEMVGNFLEISLKITFRPFDARKYRWYVYDNTREQEGERVNANNEKLNWLNCTLFNHIPFALIRATQEGLFTTYNAADFEEVNGWLLNNDDITHTSDFGGNTALVGDIIETNLKSKAMIALGINNGNDPYWYNNVRGRCLNFSYALNGNKFFSNIKPSDYESQAINFYFDRLLDKLCQNNVGVMDTYRMWGDVPINSEVTIKARVNVSGDGNERTYAVLTANPLSSETQTHFIYVTNNGNVSRVKYEYVQNSLDVTSHDGYIVSSIEQISDNSVKLHVDKTNVAANWSTISPRINFKIRKTVISE